MKGQNRKWRMGGVLFTSVMVVLATATAPAQQSYATGQNIAPVYEGWEQNPDGSFNLVFGYFNRNWEEIIDVTPGPDNTIEPGGPDQGQPTHFYPRRSRLVFRVRVPADFGDQELVWTLTTNGQTERAYATLLPEYYIDKLVITANTGGAGTTGGGDPTLHDNEPPRLRVEGGLQRTARVGQPVTLTAVARDDGIPRARPMFPTRFGQSGRIAPNSATGLRVSWFVYRGAGDVSFDPTQITEWEDSREGANSAVSAGWRTPEPPVDNQWVVRATFAKPGTYVVRCQAHDGALLVSEDVTFVVNP